MRMVEVTMDIRTKLKLKIYGEQVLRQKAEPVTEFGEPLIELCKEMYEIMHEKRGIGLAAPQVGVSKRFFIVEIEKDKNQIVLANPTIIYQSNDCEIMEEGCLSLPGVWADVVRPHSIIMQGQDLQGQMIQITASGLLARALLHEYDHLEGKLFIDHLKEEQLKEFESALKKLSKRK